MAFHLFEMFNAMIESLNTTTELKCTPRALQHIHKKLAMQATPMTLRIRLKKAGCSGWLYEFDYGSEPTPDEVTCTATGGLTVFIQRERLDFFKNAIIDYVKSGFNGLLTCVNPNEGIRCGCGESFTVEKETP